MLRGSLCCVYGRFDKFQVVQGLRGFVFKLYFLQDVSSSILFFFSGCFKFLFFYFRILENHSRSETVARRVGSSQVYHRLQHHTRSCRCGTHSSYKAPSAKKITSRRTIVAIGAMWVRFMHSCWRKALHEFFKSVPSRAFPILWCFETLHISCLSQPQRLSWTFRDGNISTGLIAAVGIGRMSIFRNTKNIGYTPTRHALEVLHRPATRPAEHDGVMLVVTFPFCFLLLRYTAPVFGT